MPHRFSISYSFCPLLRTLSRNVDRKINVGCLGGNEAEQSRGLRTNIQETPKRVNGKQFCEFRQRFPVNYVRARKRIHALFRSAISGVTGYSGEQALSLSTDWPSPVAVLFVGPL